MRKIPKIASLLNLFVFFFGKLAKYGQSTTAEKNMVVKIIMIVVTKILFMILVLKNLLAMIRKLQNWPLTGALKHIIF